MGALRTVREVGREKSSLFKLTSATDTDAPAAAPAAAPAPALTPGEAALSAQVAELRAAPYETRAELRAAAAK